MIVLSSLYLYFSEQMFGSINLKRKDNFPDPLSPFPNRTGTSCKIEVQRSLCAIVSEDGVGIFKTVFDDEIRITSSNNSRPFPIFRSKY
jgi:hypothetical protein